MLCTPESVPIEVRVSLWGSAGAFSGGVLPGPLCGKLLRGHLLKKHICKVSSQGNTILKQNQAKTAYNSFQQNTNIIVNLEQTHTPMHVFFWDVHIFTHISLRRYMRARYFATYTNIQAHSKYFCCLPSHICIFKAFWLNSRTCILKVFWLPKNYIHVYPRYFATKNYILCIFKVFLLPKLHFMCIQVFLLPKLHFMLIQVFLLPKLHFMHYSSIFAT